MSGLAAVGVAAAVLACAPAPRGPAVRVDTLWIRNVQVVPMTRDTVLPDRSVRIVGGTIDAVLPGSTPIPEGATVVEGRGRFLVPGLIDAHVHVQDTTELLSWLAYGVTTVVNLRGSPAHLRLAAAIAEGTTVGPWLHTSGPLLDGDPPVRGGPGTTVVRTPAEARAAVAAQADAGYDLIKVYNRLDPASLRAAVRAAADRGLTVVGHVPRRPDRATALPTSLEAGMAMIAHGEEIFFTHLIGALPEAAIEGGPWPIPEARVEEAVRLVAASGAAVIPNLSFVERTRRMLEDVDSVLDDPESRYLSPEIREAWARNAPTRREHLDAFAAREAVKRRVLRDLVRRLHAAGVPLLVGTDASAPGLHPGATAILELEELVRAGLSPYEALAAGTRVPGAWLERHVPEARPVGTIEPGRAADLVLVEGNPLEDVTAMRRPAGIVLRGRWWPIERLRALREAAAARFEDPSDPPSRKETP